MTIPEPAACKGRSPSNEIAFGMKAAPLTDVLVGAVCVVETAFAVAVLVLMACACTLGGFVNPALE